MRISVRNLNLAERFPELAALAAIVASDAHMVGEVTVMAVELDIAMDDRPGARARYLEIYGEPWRSLADVAMTLDLDTDTDRAARSILTTIGF